MRTLLMISTNLLMIATLAQNPDSLVAHWNFDQTENDTIFDHSANQYHGTNYGGNKIEGISGKALSFNGDGQYASIPNALAYPPSEFSTLGEGSISVWFKVDYIPPDDGIMPIFYYGNAQMCDFFDAANEGLIIEVGHSPVQYNSERLYFTIWANGCTYPSFCFDSNHAIDTGQWYHFIAVVGENYNTGFLNGEEMINRRYNFGTASYSQFFEDALAHEKMWLGRGHWDREVQYLDGAIDELRIFNKPLSPNEAYNLYTEDQTVDIGEIEKQDIKIFPNPVNGNSAIKLYNKKSQSYSLRIINTKGQTIMQQEFNKQDILIDATKFDKGIYFVELATKKEKIVKKMIVQ